MFTTGYGFKKQSQTSFGANGNSVLTPVFSGVFRKTPLKKEIEHHQTTPTSLILRSTFYIRNWFSGPAPPPLKSLTLGGNIFGHNQCHMPGSVEITELHFFQKHNTYKTICSTASVLTTKFYGIHLCKIMSKLFVFVQHSSCTLKILQNGFQQKYFKCQWLSWWCYAWSLNWRNCKWKQKVHRFIFLTWQSYSLTVSSHNFCSVFLVCPLLKHRKVSVSYAQAVFPSTAQTHIFIS